MASGDGAWVRLYPPYIAAVAASLAGLFVAFGILSKASTPAGMVGYEHLGDLGVDLAVLALLLQNFTDASAHIGNGPFWTLRSRNSSTSCTSRSSGRDGARAGARPSRA